MSGSESVSCVSRIDGENTSHTQIVFVFVFVDFGVWNLERSESREYRGFAKISLLTRRCDVASFVLSCKQRTNQFAVRLLMQFSSQQQQQRRRRRRRRQRHQGDAGKHENDLWHPKT